MRDKVIEGGRSEAGMQRENSQGQAAIRSPGIRDRWGTGLLCPPPRTFLLCPWLRSGTFLSLLMWNVPRPVPLLPFPFLPFRKGASYSKHPWLLGELRPCSCRACSDHLRVIKQSPLDWFQNSVLLEHLVELECLGSWETTTHTWTNQSVFPETEYMLSSWRSLR